jgi:hypothetical protein
MLRHHQRRCTGRKVAPSSLVIRGSVKLACAIATKLHSFTASDLAQVDIHTWLELRSQLQKHHKARIEQYRFRSKRANHSKMKHRTQVHLVRVPMNTFSCR